MLFLPPCSRISLENLALDKTKDQLRDNSSEDINNKTHAIS